ncbi:MAG TPA: GAF domain-containing protein, partial [Syntrophales bacterium]
MDTAKMMERLDISSITALSEKLNQRKKLLDITNQIHAAQNIKDILVEHKEGILALFNALLITIYVTDKPRNELYSLYLAGAQLKEIRLPITNRSIAGFVANGGGGVNIADAYDKEELKKIDKTLFFDEGWDKQSGYRTTQVLAVPVMHENALMGVIQIVNRKGGGKFTADEQSLLEEIAEVLGIALYNQHRVSSRRKTRFDYLVNHNLMKDGDLEAAFTEARRGNEPIEEILMKRFRIAREDIGRSAEDYYRCRFVHYNQKHPIPDELL